MFYSDCSNLTLHPFQFALWICLCLVYALLKYTGLSFLLFRKTRRQMTMNNIILSLSKVHHVQRLSNLNVNIIYATSLIIICGADPTNYTSAFARQFRPKTHKWIWSKLLSRARRIFRLSPSFPSVRASVRIRGLQTAFPGAASRLASAFALRSPRRSAEMQQMCSARALALALNRGGVCVNNSACADPVFRSKS